MQVTAGQLVMYDPGYKVEIGKVKRINPHDPNKAFIWYHTGDTTACTNMSDLYPIDEKFARRRKVMFENGYALENIINKKLEETEDPISDLDKEISILESEIQADLETLKGEK